MQEITGLGISRGIAIGQIYLYKNRMQTVPKRVIRNAARETARLEMARMAAHDTLEQLYIRMLDQLGETQASIFRIHQELLSDVSYADKIRSLIETKRLSAEYAVQTVCQEYMDKFSRIDNEYIRQRAADIQDVSDRLLRILRGLAPLNPADIGGRFILAANDLSPSETVQMDCHNVLGIVTAEGSRVSHAAILARSLDIPAVTSIGSAGLSRIRHMCIAIVDGVGGKVILEPDERTLQEYRRRQREYFAGRERLLSLRGKESQTLDGTKVHIAAHLNLPEETGLALENDAQGIGLLRSEYLYLEQPQLPTEEEQYRAYRQVLEDMNGLPVNIRTLDLGADKTLRELHPHRETNPALGNRAIRFCLRNPKLFKIQLRALLRASAQGNLSILLPMVISPTEVTQTRQLLEQCRTDLERDGVSMAHKVPLGVMIETPSAVMMAPELASVSDFFMIGSNDLTQYALAVDRSSRDVEYLFDHRHPTVLRMIAMAASAAQMAGISCGVTGEVADDFALLEQLLLMGISSFAVSPARVLELKERVRGILLHSR